MPAVKRSAPKSAPAKKATAARKPKAAAPRKGAAKPKATKAAAPATRGPSAETLAFAKKVVDLRDQKKLAWKDVAAKLDVKYDQNGSSRLRRAYILGNGATVGTRNAAK